MDEGSMATALNRPDKKFALKSWSWLNEKFRGPFDDTGNLVGRFISTMGLQTGQ
jgi:hypothetical protein